MRFRVYISAVLACGALLSLAGCPTVSSDLPAPAAETSLRSPNPTTQRPPAVDDLARRFPTCGDLSQADSWRAEILFLVNRERSQRGLVPLVRNPVLEDQATQYACEMIHDDFFAHENPASGSTLPDRADEFGYDYLVIGENLAAGQSSPQQTMQDWMNSPGHAANVLDVRFTEIGIGVRSGGEFGLYWVQEFGLPSASNRTVQAP